MVKLFGSLKYFEWRASARAWSWKCRLSSSRLWKAWFLHLEHFETFSLIFSFSSFVIAISSWSLGKSACFISFIKFLGKLSIQFDIDTIFEFVFSFLFVFRLSFEDIEGAISNQLHESWKGATFELSLLWLLIETSSEDKLWLRSGKAIEKGIILSTVDFKKEKVHVFWKKVPDYTASTIARCYFWLISVMFRVNSWLGVLFTETFDILPEIIMG